MFQFTIMLVGALLLQTPSLTSTNQREQLAAVDAMATPGNEEAIPVFAEALKREPRKEVRGAMVAGLARIGSPNTVPVLAEVLATDLDKDVRLQAVDSFQRLYIPIEDTGPIRTIFNRVRSVFSEPDRPLVADGVAVHPGTTTALASAMQRDFHRDVRVAAARALGSLRARDQVPALTAFLESPQSFSDRNVRVEIIQSLGVIRDPAAGPSLERTLRDSDNRVVEEAITSIGLTGYREARPVLEQMFRTDRRNSIKRRAIEALALMRDPGSILLFESMLSSSDDYFREMAAEGLARLDYDPSRFVFLFEQERRAEVRNAFAFALASADQTMFFDHLAGALDSRQDYQAEAYLYELGKFEGKLPQLHRYLQSTNPRVRARMAKVVGDIGDPSSREPLTALMQDTNVEVLREATAALRRLNVQ